jgi:hypothetical protein
MARNTRMFATTLAAGAAFVAVSSGVAAAQTPVAGEYTAQVTCVGTSFASKLGTNQAICNSGYRVIMQDNGDLVLRRSNGSACYASGTRAPGDASAVFVANWLTKPWVNIESASQGLVGRIEGAHNASTLGKNASVNNRGEFWIGYRKIGYC